MTQAPYLKWDMGLATNNSQTGYMQKHIYWELREEEHFEWGGGQVKQVFRAGGGGDYL